MATSDGETSPSLTAGDSPGALIAGRYELVGLIGVGGMGSVYRAVDRRLDERVALKMLRPDFVTDPEIVERFRAEVRLARRVTHRNVARTFDIGEHEGARFLTMELIDGESLAALLSREGPLAVLRTVDIANGICGGLAAAHAAGVVHRDLKPENVIIAADGRVVLTDFGIARAYLESSALRTQGIVGTPAYMAPEQVEGREGIDGRADIYALGALLFEMATGVCPWRGDSPLVVAAARLIAPPPDPSALRADLPDTLVRLIVRCMATRTEDRPARVEEIASTLSEMTLPAPPVATAAPSSPVAIHASEAPPSTHPPKADRADAKTVAVLPFRNTGTADDDYLAEGLTDDLVDTLSMTAGLKVRPRSVVARLASADSDPREVGRALGVQVVVDGTLRRTSPDGLRINARLVSVMDGFQLWARRFDCAAGEVLAVGDQAASAIAAALTVDAPQPGPADSMIDPVAVDLFLRARHALRHGWVGGRTDEAVELWKQAYARAPRDPVIVSGYAHVLMRGAIDADNPADMARAKALAEQAMALAPDAVEVRYSLASIAFVEGAADVAARHLRHVLASAQGSAHIQSLAGLLMCEVGMVDEGLSRLRAAIALDPSLDLARWEAARVSELCGNSADADALLGEAPGSGAPASAGGYWLMRMRLVFWRADAAGAQQVARLLQDASFPRRDLLLAVASMISTGKPPSGVLDALRQRRVSGNDRRASFGAQVSAEAWCFAGEVEEALAALEGAGASGIVDVLWLERCPVLAPLRAHPGYAGVHRRVEARAARVREVFATG